MVVNLQQGACTVVPELHPPLHGRADPRHSEVDTRHYQIVDAAATIGDIQWINRYRPVSPLVHQMFLTRGGVKTQGGVKTHRPPLISHPQCVSKTISGLWAHFWYFQSYFKRNIYQFNNSRDSS